MLGLTRNSPTRTWNLALSLSFAIHALVLVVLIRASMHIWLDPEVSKPGLGVRSGALGFERPPWLGACAGPGYPGWADMAAYARRVKPQYDAASAVRSAQPDSTLVVENRDPVCWRIGKLINTADTLPPDTRHRLFVVRVGSVNLVEKAQASVGPKRGFVVDSSMQRVVARYHR